MSDLSFRELSDELDFAFFLDTEGIQYKETFGSSGEQFNIRECPECGGDKWKVYVGVDSGLGNCFKCEARFNKLTFMKAYYDLKDWSQVRFKCEEILRTQGWRPKRKAKEVKYEIPDVVLPLSMALPTPAGETLQYLADRGISNEITAQFGLRYSQHGLWFYVNDEGKRVPQNFSERLIIPVFDLDATLKTFQGRDLRGTSDRKYLFPMRLPGTGKYLLNGHNAIASPHVIIGEGAFDVMAIQSALKLDPSYEHVTPVGTFGKHLSYGNTECDDQIGRLNVLRQHGLRTVTIMWDGEVSALEAALKTAAIITGLGLEARVSFLPRDKDPNEIPPEEVLKAFTTAITWSPIVDVKLKMRNPYR
ncbi:DNA primase [Ochrobactrum sp. P20RRXII]|nr:DNA primase [Ochrobactrum sp. P20RRXII]NIH77448.1 DNA primase [Ochrobactrum sp. P20RRXII]